MLPPATTDSFSGRYPILMLLQGCGEACNWVDGRGYTASWGTVHEEPRGVDPQVTLFETDMQSIQVEFLDCNYETISFTDNADLTVILSLTPVS
jgi:hypothetical protein